MLIPHDFDELTHRYYEKGSFQPHRPRRFVIGLSSIIALNGLSDHSAVPLGALLRAATRGNEFDSLIQDFESGVHLRPYSKDVLDCWQGYLKFKAEHDVKLAGPMQCRMVWEHKSTGILIGCTPDLILYIDGELYNVDTKTTYPLSGKAKKMKNLAWRIQLQGQLEAWEANTDWWKAGGIAPHLHKAILHCHPKLKNGYELIEFPQDDTDLFESAIRMAIAKLEAGFEEIKR